MLLTIQIFQKSDVGFYASALDYFSFEMGYIFPKVRIRSIKMTLKVMAQEQDLGTYIQNLDLNKLPFQSTSQPYTEPCCCLCQ